MIYPFVEKPAPIEEIKGSNAYHLHEVLKEKSFKELSKEERKLIEITFNELWNPDTYKHGVYKLRGYKISFKEHLKRYFVKTKYYGIMEIFAFNKTLIRKCATTPSHILEIVEVG